jgi:hypothetical protein
MPDDSVFRRHFDPLEPWNGAPRWAQEIGEMLAVSICQGEMILAHLQGRPSLLSPEDQTIMYGIFHRAAAIAKAKTEIFQQAADNIAKATVTAP